jgi:hypothetical protein
MKKNKDNESHYTIFDYLNIDIEKEIEKIENAVKSDKKQENKSKKH